MNKKETAKAEVRRQQLELLAFIREEGKASPRDIINHFDISPKAIGGMICALSKQREIVGVDSGKKNAKSLPIIEYYLTNTVGEIPAEAKKQQEKPFPLGEIFHLAPPKFTATNARQHYCE